MTNGQMTEKKADSEPKFERSCCPITNTLDILGDKWTLLVIRDLVLGKKRYRELISSPEKIASNILANRLKRLEVCGLVTRQAYQQNPSRYEYVLTRKGEDLRPVLEAMSRWGQEHYPGTMIFSKL
ncbi:helix-turn-helix domain-containing protein [Nitrosospira sp. NpAV]|uniref:winged helix-turn-helix transcriptional regulator n=1 Tax=Nitrosospira sp. NpAV TaxID=58133 RepID=UPI000A059A90|nr:helix-turn-helix domain-containing protein [Nitrosospira sp. NpAV]